MYSRNHMEFSWEGADLRFARLSRNLLQVIDVRVCIYTYNPHLGLINPLR